MSVPHDIEPEDYMVIPRPRGILRAVLGFAGSVVRRGVARDHGDTLTAVTALLTETDRAATVTSGPPGGAWSVTIARRAEATTGIEQLALGPVFPRSPGDHA